MNKVLLIGHLGSDPELKNGNFTVCKFSLATSEIIDGEKKTEWHRIVCFSKLADNCAKFIKKGSHVFVEGKIKTNKWEDKDGQTRYTTEIIAHAVKFLDSKGSKDENSNAANDVLDEIPF